MFSNEVSHRSTALETDDPGAFGSGVPATTTVVVPGRRPPLERPPFAAFGGETAGARRLWLAAAVTTALHGGIGCNSGHCDPQGCSKPIFVYNEAFDGDHDSHVAKADWSLCLDGTRFDFVCDFPGPTERIPFEGIVCALVPCDFGPGHRRSMGVGEMDDVFAVSRGVRLR